MKMQLAMDAPGATVEQVGRGLAAAEAVFARHETTAQEVAEALAAREYDEHAGAFIPPEDCVDGKPPKATVTRRQMQIADLWYEADDAAVAACYGDASARPERAQLVLFPRDAGSPSLQ